jgi:hypothetical protein
VGAIIELTLRPGGIRWKPCGFRSSSPSMLLTWTPVPGTSSPDPVPFEQVTLAHIPSESIAVRCVVDPNLSPGAPPPERPPAQSPELMRSATASRSAAMNSRT